MEIYQSTPEAKKETFLKIIKEYTHLESGWNQSWHFKAQQNVFQTIVHMYSGGHTSAVGAFICIDLVGLRDNSKYPHRKRSQVICHNFRERR